MTTTIAPRATRRADLISRPFGEDGQYVVKSPDAGDYFHLGGEEHFLLMQLDGCNDPANVCQAYEREFGGHLTEVDLDEFIESIREHGLLEEGDGTDAGQTESPSVKAHTSAECFKRRSSKPRQSSKQQNILYFRKSVFDPDRLLTWLEPRLWFLWTKTFLVTSVLSILAAILLLWINASEATTALGQAVRWETAVLVWLTLFAVCTLHEFAHGLTCKHYGGEVHEIGFLMMFFMPCFYCNVSDAWLFREKSKRLWVTFAGGYLDLVLWSLAVFVWRVTDPATLVNYLAFVILSVCGIQSLFNFNPLIKLDGYYLLADWLDVPNLRDRAMGRFQAHARSWLWGAAAPEADDRGRALTGFGMMSWVYSMLFLCGMLAVMLALAAEQAGVWGVVVVTAIGIVAVVTLCRGCFSRETIQMFYKRTARAVAWLLAAAGVIAVMRYMEIDDRAGGAFRLRAANRVEVRAPVSGFLSDICVVEGAAVEAGSLMAVMDIPDLQSRAATKQAEILEARAELALLQAGTRPEAIATQRQRVEHAKVHRNLARRALAQQEQIFREQRREREAELDRCRAECDAAREAWQRAARLRQQNAATDSEVQAAKRALDVFEAQREQAAARLRALEAEGTLSAEIELAARDRELSDAQANLRLIEAGARQQQIDAKQASLQRLIEEHDYVEMLKEKTSIRCPIDGLVTTPLLKEKVGQYFEEGQLICIVEDQNTLEADVMLSEQQSARISASQPATLKARMLPTTMLDAKVDRVAPTAEPGETHSTMTVVCQIHNAPGELKPGMSGYARISTGRRPLGRILFDRTLRYLRTEFWW